MKRLFLIFLLLIIAVPCFGGQTLKRHLEPETVNYFSLPSSSGDQFTFNEQIKLIKYNGGSVTLSGLVANFSNVAGFQFVSNPSVDLRKWIGYYITFTSSAGNTLKVKVSAAGTSETLGNELVDTWTNHGTYPYSTLTLGVGNLITQAVATTTGTVIKTSTIAGMLIKNTNTWTKSSGESPVVCMGTVTSVSNVVTFTSNSTSYKTASPITTTGFIIYNNNPSDWGLTSYSSRQVLTPSATGIYFTDPVVIGTFNYNAASFTAVVSRY